MRERWRHALHRGIDHEKFKAAPEHVWKFRQMFPHPPTLPTVSKLFQSRRTIASLNQRLLAVLGGGRVRFRVHRIEHKSQSSSSSYANCQIKGSSSSIIMRSHESFPGNREIPEVHPPTRDYRMAYDNIQILSLKVSSQESFAISLTITVVDRKSLIVPFGNGLHG